MKQTKNENWEKEWKIFKRKWLEVAYGLPNGVVNHIEKKIYYLLSKSQSQAEKRGYEKCERGFKKLLKLIKDKEDGMIDKIRQEERQKAKQEKIEMLEGLKRAKLCEEESDRSKGYNQAVKNFNSVLQNEIGKLK